MVGRDAPFYLKVSAKMTYPHKTELQSIFTHSTSAVIPREKKVMISLI